MSKQLTALLLKNKISGKNEQDQRNYLIECLKKQGLIESPVISPDRPVTLPTICEVCNSNDVIFSSHEILCKNCGAAKSDSSINPFQTFKQDLNFSKSSFIEPGTLTVNVIKDGKIVSRDLSKLNTWLTSDPEDQRIVSNMKNLLDIVDKLRQYYNPVIFERVEKEIISMWYNILTVNKTMYGKEKKALLAWSIYYPMVFNNLNVPLQRIANLTETFIGDIYSHNFRLKDLFKGTSFEKYISIPIGTKSDIILPQKIQDKLKIMKRDLRDYIKEPIKDKQLYGMIYYISKNVPDKFFTLADLAEKSLLSTVTILNESKTFEQFYKKSPKLKENLFS
jgi:transcription initiation factor TFIIIB Brf1 subunit/transcription initiation factor TFIIB